MTAIPQRDMDHVERLQRENAKLKMELEDLKGQYRQLVSEGPEEDYGERRVNLLKAQLMQLERQVVLLSEGLSSQVCRCLDVEKALDPLTHTLRSLLCSNLSSAEVTVSRSELTRLIEMCASVTQILQRNNKVNTVEGLSMPWVLAPPSLPKQPITLLDLCYNRTDTINLQYVSSLECGLSLLFKHLQGLKHTLTHILVSKDHPHHSPPAPRGLYDHLLSQASVCLSALERCCTDLLPLSLLGPYTPEVRPEQDVCVELKVEDVLSLFPPLSRGAQQRAARAAQAIARTHNHARHVAQLQLEAAEAELQFHRALSSLQADLSQQLTQGLRHAYRDFQNNIQHSVCDPLQDILSCYDALVISASEAALKDFLSVFERSQSDLREAVQALTPSQEHGEEALAQCGQDFLLAADRLRREWEEQRDRTAWDLKSGQEEYDSALLGLETLRRERRERRHSDTPDTHTPTPNPDTHTPTPASGKSLRSDPALNFPLSVLSNHSTPGQALANDNSHHTDLSNHRALVSDVASGVSALSLSSNSPAMQRLTNQKVHNKALPRPPWQS